MAEAGGASAAPAAEDAHVAAAPAPPTQRVEVVPDEHTPALKECFALLDKGDGTVPVSELGVLMGAMGVQPTDAEVQVVLRDSEAENAAAGLGGTGVSFPIFHAFMAHKLKEVNRLDATREAFKHLEDGAGFITLPELRHMILTSVTEKLTMEEVDELLALADLDKDGKVNMAEFEKMMLAAV